MTDNSTNIPAQHSVVRPDTTARSVRASDMRGGNLKGLLVIAILVLFICVVLVLQYVKIPAQAEAALFPLPTHEGLVLGEDYIYRPAQEPTSYVMSKPLHQLDDELVLGRDKAQLPPCLTAPLRWEP